MAMGKDVNRDLTLSLMETVASNVRRLLRTKNIKIGELAEKMNCSRQYVYLIRFGVCNVTLENLEKLAEALEVKASELFRSPRGKDRIRPTLPAYLRQAHRKDSKETKDLEEQDAVIA